MSNLINRKDNFHATEAPGADDDMTQGYRPGSYWIDVENTDVHVCVSAAPGDARWLSQKLKTIEVTATSLDAFFLGHSLLGHDIPNNVERFAGDVADVALSLDYGVGNGASLEYHWNNPTSGEGDNARVSLAAGPYDVVVLTESVPIENQEATSVANFLNFANLAYAENASAQLYLYETWEDRDDTTGGIRSAIDTRRVYYERIRAGVNASFSGPDVRIIPGGQAVGMLLDAIGDGDVSDLTDADDLFVDEVGYNIHPTELLSYFLGCVFYATLYQRTPVGLPASLLDRFGTVYATVPTAAMAADMQAIAWAAVQADPYSGVDAVVGVPTVVSMTPASMSTGFDVEGDIAVTFSEAMNAATIYGETLRLTDIDGTLVASSISTVGAVATISPTSALANTTEYTVTATTEIRNDATATYLAANRALSFTSGVAVVVPALVSTFPADNATGVVWNNVEVTFDIAMDPTTMTASELAVTGDGSPVAITITYPSAATVQFSVDGGLQDEVLYAVTLSGAESADGVAAADVSFSFTSQPF